MQVITGSNRFLTIFAFALSLAAVNAQEWEKWASWNDCSKTCGMGIQIRERGCKSGSCPNSGKFETKNCNLGTCPPPECGGNLTTASGVVTSPNYPNAYPNNYDCTWNVVVETGYRIEFKFNRFELDASCSDHLTIRSNGQTIGNYCGQQIVSNVGTNGNKATVEFTSDPQMAGNGFSITYEAKIIPKCSLNWCYHDGVCNGLNTCDCSADASTGFYRCGYSLFPSLEGTNITVTSPRKTSSSCVMYGKNKVKTFDGHYYWFNGRCQYVMARTEDNSLEVLIRRSAVCESSYPSCVEAITVLYASTSVTIHRDGTTKFGNTPMTLPIMQFGFEVVRSGWSIFVMVGGHKVEIDTVSFTLSLKVNSKFAGKMAGLCGNFNGDPKDDFSENGLSSGNSLRFSNIWIRNLQGERCPFSNLAEQLVCDITDTKEKQKQKQVCDVLLSSAFETCRRSIDVSPFLDQCISDVCACKPELRADCHCSVVAQYAKECAKIGAKPGSWRTPSSCFRKCPGNQQYEECASPCQSTCETMNLNYCDRECTAGCECAAGTYWDSHSSMCVARQACPCTHAGTKYMPGETREKKCQTCLCKGAVWSCIAKSCSATTSAHGFSHFITFDGTHYDYPGRCTYLFVGDCPAGTFNVYITTKECGSGGAFSCVRKVHITVPGKTTVTLLPDKAVSVNNNAPTNLPVTTGPLGISVYEISSLYIAAYIQHLQVQVLWDGRSTVSVRVPHTYRGKLCGLGGKYNRKSKDDLMSRYGSRAQPIDFANSWEHYAVCVDVPVSQSQTGACIKNQHLQQASVTECNIILEPAFKACREAVDHTLYHQACKTDVCSCERGSKCFCDAIAFYAHECLTNGFKVDWRGGTSCGIQCTGKKTYQVSGTSCGRSCRSLMEVESCSPLDKVEGCNCPLDMYLSNDNTCVKKRECPCYYQNSWIKPGHIVHQNKIPCYCVDGVVSCNRQAGEDESQLACPSNMKLIKCSTLSAGEVGAECALTCLNRNESTTCQSLSCQSGCICQNGYVLHKGKCIEPSTCPCEFQGKMYQVGNTTKSGCEVMECTATGWQVISRDRCYSQCSVVGGAYYTSFDGLHTTFKGSCEYILATDACSGTANEDFSYRITVKSHDCPGSNTAMCATSVTAILGMWKFNLEKGQQPSVTRLDYRKNYYQFQYNLVHRGSYVIITTHDVDIIWDGSTRVYVRFFETRKGKTTCGLCGNMDGDMVNDKRTQVGDAASSDIKFGNGWKVLPMCADMVEKNTTDSCGNKLSWAQKKCGIMKGKVFEACRATISADSYYRECVAESCSCDTGGDCECYCTAVSHYAFACGEAGVEVLWRNADNCPMMCELKNTGDDCVWKYTPCTAPCLKSCCSNCIEGCFDGCNPHCPPGTTLDESTNQCVTECPDTCILPPKPPIECHNKADRICTWSAWTNTQLTSVAKGGDFSSIADLQRAFPSCNINNIRCKSLSNMNGTVQKNVQCNKRVGLACHNSNMASGTTCDEYTVQVECCSCGCNNVTCQPLECDRHEVAVVVKKADFNTTCCNKEECVCAGCWANAEFKVPGSVWTENCTDYTCVSNNAGCYKIQSSPKSCPVPTVVCPDYAEDTVTYNSGQCCPTHNCECKPENKETHKLNCDPPRVLEMTRLINGSLECVKHECVCPNNKTMGNMTCVEPADCSSPGCHRTETKDCDCLLTSTCVCDPTNCPPLKNCSDCTTRTVVPANSSPDSCAMDTCCSKVQCDPIQCNTTSVTCKSWEKKVPVENFDHCCPEYTCTCDNTQLHLCPGSNDSCPVFARLVKSQKLINGDKCCYEHKCECLSKYDPSNTLTCAHPEIQETTKLEHGSLTCATHRCVCPRNETMGNVTCVESANCSVPGCHKNETSNCDCIISSECVCDSSNCPPLKNCPACTTRTVVPAKSFPDSCAMDTCCSKVQCDPIQCNTTSVTCKSWEKKYLLNNGSCCPEQGCVCDKCEEEGSVFYVGDLWSDQNDLCVHKFCHPPDKVHSCPYAVVDMNLTAECTTQVSSCGPYETLKKDESDVCCTRYRCECNASMCPADPVCTSPSTLEPDPTRSDKCCNVTKCTPLCYDRGVPYKKGDTWQHPYNKCLRKLCSCADDSCQVTDINAHSCPSVRRPTCANHLPLISVPNQDNECCSHYVCPCFCTVFGDPHYLTFDGSQYTFMGECHYTLVKYRESDKLHIYSDNYACVRNNDFLGTCLKTIFVQWDGTVVEINNLPGYNYAQSVKVNGTTLTSLPWSNNGLNVQSNPFSVVVTIPEIGLWLKFLMIHFPAVFIKVPPTQLFNRTVGLCGTCTNNQLDDYEGKNGTYISNTNEFGYDWELDIPEKACQRCDMENNPACWTCEEKMYEEKNVPLPDWCNNCTDDHCNILNEPKFKACHSTADPSAFLRACQYDASALSKCDVCDSSSIDTYVEQCQQKGICIEWKKDHNCTVTCSGLLEYKECVPKCKVLTCQNYMDTGTCQSNEYVSGCVCPDGYVQKEPGSTECVTTNCCNCPAPPLCIAPKILRTVPGQEGACCPQKECVCPEASPINCTLPKVSASTESECPGFYCKCPTNMSYCPAQANCTSKLGCKIKVLERDECGCATNTTCGCDTSLCPGPPDCGECMNFTIISRPSNGDECAGCCTKYLCVRQKCVDPWANITIPEGCKLVTSSPKGTCCPVYKLQCDNCLTNNGTMQPTGSTWYELIEGCNVKYVCSEKINKTGIPYHIKEIEQDPRTNCISKDAYENDKCVNPNEIAVEVGSTNPCCKNYSCVCNCSAEYKPPPNREDLKDYQDLVLNPSIGCCPSWEVICKACVLQNGTALKPGETFTIVDKSGCEIEMVCSNTKVNKTACHDMNIAYDPRTKCQSASDFSCSSQYKHAEEISYKVGETDRDLCCPEFQCVCNNKTMLSKECPKWLNYTCPDPKKVAVQTNTIGDQQCCPEFDCTCKKVSELNDLCEETLCNDSNKEAVTLNITNCCPVKECQCKKNSELQCPELQSCAHGETQNDYTEQGECCPKRNCTCGDIPENCVKYPSEPKQPYQIYVPVKPMNVCCPEYTITCGNTSLCPPPNCPVNHTAISRDPVKDPNTQNCCPLYKCICDVCVESNTTRAVGENWQIDVGNGCMVTYECSPTQRKNLLTELESSGNCHKVIKISDPRQKCQSITYHEHTVCNSYQTAVERKYESDPDVCCPEFKCICKEGSKLQTACSSFPLPQCPPNMQIVKSGTVFNTTDCCPNYSCICNNETMLRHDCQQWTNFSCSKPGYKRIQNNTLDMTNGPCCPTYQCVCQPEEILAQICTQWNFYCPAGQRRVKTNTDCCPTYKCVCDKCVMDGAIYPVNVTWVSADDVCTTHTCVMNYTSGCPEKVAAEKYDCAPVDLKECVKKGGSIYGNESTSGCCKLCNSVATPCERSVNREILNTTINGHACWSAAKQDVAICSGSCQTSQSYDENTGLPNGICRCCKTAMTSKKTYSMYCDDGTNRDHEHVEIMACGCEETACEAVTTPSP